MIKYNVYLVGFDTCEWGHTNKVIEIEAKTEEEARKKAQNWCDDNSLMGGYEWHIEKVGKKDE